MKTCSSCNKDKPFDSFYKQKGGLHGLMGKCKECHISKQKERCQETLNEVAIDFCITCNTCRESKSSIYFSRSRNHKNGFLPSCKVCSDKKNKEWVKNNKESLKTYRNNYNKDRKTIDPLYKLSKTSRALIHNSFKRIRGGVYKKSKKTEEVLGCTLEEFIRYLESLFKEGMNLNNNGNCEECWHIDHKIPLSSAKTEEDIIRLCHYTNLQPLWSRENLSKYNKQ